MSTLKASQEKKKYEKEKRKKIEKKKRKKERKKRSKKKIFSSSSNREYNTDSLMRKKIEKRYMIQKANGRWPWLVTTFGWWSLFKNKTKKKYFLSLYILFFTTL